MATEFFSSSRLHTVDGQHIEPTREGAIRSIGNTGQVLFGPYLRVENGLYRAKARAHVEEGKSSYFEVFDASTDCNIYAAVMFRDNPEVFVRVYQSTFLEFRFRTFGETLVVKGIELEPLLLDTDRATTVQLRRLIDHLMKVAAQPSAVFYVLDRLAGWGGVVEAERLRSLYVASRSGPEIDRPDPPFEEASERGTGFPPTMERNAITALVWADPLKIVECLQITPDVRSVLHELGYEADFLRATYLHRDYDEPPRRWHQRPAEPGDMGVYPPRQPLFERYPDIDRSFQASMARGAGLAAYCPVSGRLLRSRHAFLQLCWDLPFTFHRFDGVQTFYVCTGNVSNTKLFVYMPQTQTICLIGDPWYRNYPAENVTRYFRVNLERHAKEIAVYLASETQPAIVIGNNIYGHFFWTSLSGLQYAHESGLLENMAGLVKVPRQFIEPELVFPEIAHLPSANLTDEGEIFLHCVRQNYLPIHFTDVSMNESLVERLRGLARERASDAGRPPADVARPLVWINLRAHTKVWVNQAEGYANILNALYEDYGQVAGFIDGMPDCAAIAAEIRAKTRLQIVLHDGLNLSFYDTLSWAMAVDGYISVISSGLLIVDVLAGKSGVAHAEHGHLTQMEWWHTILPGNGAPLSPTPDQVTEIGGGLYSDYDVDWRVLLDLIRRVLDERLPRRQAVAA